MCVWDYEKNTSIFHTAATEEKKNSANKQRKQHVQRQKSGTKKWMEWKIISFESEQNECAHQREREKTISTATFTRRQRHERDIKKKKSYECYIIAEDGTVA